ncbi:MAG TPA: DUF4198 domain-containing protein [Rhodocyclaceae bacterium]|jgi:uncharacterized GH25 family protein
MTLRPLKLAALLALGSLGLHIAPAAAHNVWLQPSSTILAKAQWITVDAAVSNDLFFVNHMPLALDNLAVTAPDGSLVAPENALRGKLRSVFDLNLSQAGTYRIAVLNGGIMASYKLNGETKRWRGTAETFAKEVPADAEELKVNESAGRVETFVTVGKPSVLKNIGKGLELQAVGKNHPNDLVAGETTAFRLLLDGKPVSGVNVSLIRGGTRYRNQLGELKFTTDSDGKFSITWPEAGLYWLEAATTDNKTTVPAAKERRASYAATLEVQPQ